MDRTARGSGLTIGILGMLAVHSCALVAQPASYQVGVRAGRIAAQGLKEISGLAVSRRNADVIWVHNDSGDGPFVYAVNPAGELLATFLVSGAQAVDWEDIAIGPGPEPNEDYLYIADIGDNNARRPNVVVYRVKEPLVDPNARDSSGRTIPAEAMRLVYPDGPKDAEALFVDPLSADIYIISKREPFSHLYRLAHPRSGALQYTLESVKVLPVGLVTAADISLDGSRLVIRTMLQAYIWHRDKGQSVAKAFGPRFWVLPLQQEAQGEAIGFDRRGGYYTISEGSRPQIYYFAPAQQ